MISHPTSSRACLDVYSPQLGRNLSWDGPAVLVVRFEQTAVGKKWGFGRADSALNWVCCQSTCTQKGLPSGNLSRQSAAQGLTIIESHAIGNARPHQRINLAASLTGTCASLQADGDGRAHLGAAAEGSGPGEPPAGVVPAGDRHL